jgi:tRNA pseudouridine38-40 synthase
MRVALGIEYDGTSYNGWQRQKTGLGVQQRVEEALSIVANQPVEVICAGRTDTGVHATDQVVHFDTDSDRSERGWLLGANTNLPDDINVSWVTLVADDFHARFSAMSRSYRYLILNRLQRSALHRHRAWWVYEPLDAERMNAAAQLSGQHRCASPDSYLGRPSGRLDYTRCDGECIPAAHGAKYHGYDCDSRAW